MTASWVFLAFAIWCSLWTLVSFLPPKRPAVFMMVGFFAAWSTTELAPCTCSGRAIAVVVLIAFGALIKLAGLGRARASPSRHGSGSRRP